MPTWSCPACKEYFPKLQNVTVVKTSYLEYNSHAFVVYDPYYYVKPTIVISFAGTVCTHIFIS